MGNNNDIENNKRRDIRYVFERVEKKFVLTVEQYEKMLSLVEKHLLPSSYPEYDNCSIYYDTKDFYVLRKKIMTGKKFVEKLRIRSYGIPNDDSLVYIELKGELNGVVYKRRVSVSFSVAKDLLAGKEVACDSNQALVEIKNYVKRYEPIPQVVVYYSRKGFHGMKEGDIRITFDRGLKYSITDLEKPCIEKLKPMIDEDKVIMEVKTIDSLPLWLVKELSKNKIFAKSFSKSRTCYCNHILPMYYKKGEKYVK